MPRPRSLAPVTLLALVAVAAACEQPATPPVAQKSVVPDSADQVMFGVRFFLTDGGLRRAELVSDTAYMYDDNTRTELRVVNTTFYKVSGEKDAVLTSKTGSYNIRLGNMEARGNVLLVATDGRKLETPHLRYDPSRNEIASDSAFTITETGGRITQGIGFIGDPDLNNVRVLKSTRSRGSAVTIPKS
ncbi:MAG TPA: LPS export ABC transporter periplasmic protein LptC [Gemmatimonadaceae bacterium]|nr:LPS export ABC transporter periplasmic protein LptC [Gemmatimonadaceae bacterium]